jgi:dipeptidyl aminopeptidase/acylaminoacyl peptidase
LLLPEGTKPVPAIVFVQGAGPETRSASRFLGEYFAERGIAALIYDKRGAGASTGDWKHSSFEDLARDVTASVNLLRGRPEIDSHRIGLMGSSQGGWIAPMAASEISGIAFVIAKSAAAVTPEQQELARVRIQMRAEGDSADDIAQALHLYKHAIAYANSKSDWDSLKAEIGADSQKKWTMFDADTPKDYWFFDQIRLFFGHDPLSVIRELKPPLLVIFGGRDDDGPPLGCQIGPLMTAMSAQGKKSQLTIFPDAGHDLRVVVDKGQAWQFERFAPGYLDTLTSWVEAQTK